MTVDYSFVLYSLTQNDRENKFIMSKLKQNPTRPKSIFINDLRPAMLSLEYIFYNIMYYRCIIFIYFKPTFIIRCQRRSVFNKSEKPFCFWPLDVIAKACIFPLEIFKQRVIFSPLSNNNNNNKTKIYY